jgi:hypothetical protein
MGYRRPSTFLRKICELLEGKLGPNLVRRCAVLLVSIAATVLTTSTAAAAEALPSCLDHQWVGDAGVINVRTSPSGTIAWNVQDHTDNGGLWIALVYVDKRLVDKKSQNYNPHGSVNTRDTQPGSVFRLDITHTDSQGRISRSVPNGCIVP